MTKELDVISDLRVSGIDAATIPPILIGNATPAVVARVRDFYLGVEEMFERWIARRENVHTQRAYRQGMMDFVEFLGILWPDDGSYLFTVKVGDVQDYRDHLIARGYAPNTRNHRICSVSAFYKYLRESAIELRLPVNIPNPAHPQFVSRVQADPIEETQALSQSKARLLRTLPSGVDVLAYRDRAILDFYLYSGARIATGCRLRVEDFFWDDEDPRLWICEKGSKRRMVGINRNAAVSIRDYIEFTQLRSGALFRPRLNSRSRRLGSSSIAPSTMYYLLDEYLRQLPNALREAQYEDGSVSEKCIYSPHSIRATTATLLLDAGEPMEKVQELLGHKLITTTQIYDKRRRAPIESASHNVPI